MKGIRISTTERPLFSPEELISESIGVGTLRLANVFGTITESLFKKHGLTGAQYNTLRVLRDAPPEGLSCQEISNALIQRDPDITRLADRLEERGLVVKERAQTDRRVVMVRITEQGVSLVNELDWPVARSHVESLTAFDASEKRQFLRLLDKLLKSHNSPSSAL